MESAWLKGRLVSFVSSAALAIPSELCPGPSGAGSLALLGYHLSLCDPCWSYWGYVPTQRDFYQHLHLTEGTLKLSQFKDITPTLLAHGVPGT